MVCMFCYELIVNVIMTLILANSMVLNSLLRYVTLKVSSENEQPEIRNDEMLYIASIVQIGDSSKSDNCRLVLLYYIVLQMSS